MDTTHKNTPSLVIDFEHDDDTKQNHLMVHVTNLLKDFDNDPLNVEVVCYGPGIMLLVAEKTKYEEQISELQARGVVFHACRNAMSMFNVTDEELISDATPVPSGVGRIVKAQIEGSVYLKG